MSALATTAPVRPSAVRQAVLLAASDLRAELRARDTLLVTAPFAATALLLLPLAIGADTPRLHAVGTGVSWVIVLLFGTLVVTRRSDRDAAASVAAVRLAGVPAAARLLSRSAADAVVLLALQAVLLPVAVALYDLSLPGWPVLLALVPLVAVGLAVLGTVATALTAGGDPSGTTAPLLVAPLAVPLLLGATQALEATAYHRSPAPWVLLVVVVDTLLVTAAVLAAHHLEEDT